MIVVIRSAKGKTYHVREMLAKVKAVYDVCIDKQPKYLGESPQGVEIVTP